MGVSLNKTHLIILQVSKSHFVSMRLIQAWDWLWTTLCDWEDKQQHKPTLALTKHTIIRISVISPDLRRHNTLVLPSEKLPSMARICYTWLQCDSWPSYARQIQRDSRLLVVTNILMCLEHPHLHQGGWNTVQRSCEAGQGRQEIWASN